MIKEAIIIGGFVFYIFVINALVADIRMSVFIQAKRISTNPSSESSMTTRTASSLSNK
jgi:hypothetical protein